MSNMTEILKFARSRDRQGLKNLLSKKICVDEYTVVSITKIINKASVISSVLLTPAAFLAAQGERGASDFLKDRFAANIDWIAYGAALGRDRIYAEELRAAGADIDYIAEGAACGGYFTYTQELYYKYGADIYRIARGAACGGYRRFTDDLRKQRPIELRFLTNWIAYGAACGGHEYYARLLYFEGAEVSWIAAGAAQGGYLKFANELIFDKNARKDYVAFKAAAAGHYDYAEKLGPIESAVYGAVLGGHFAYVEKVLAKNKNLDEITPLIVCGSINGRHFAFLEDLYFRKIINKNFLTINSAKIAKSKTQLLRALAHTKTEIFREAYIYQLREKYKNFSEYLHLQDSQFLKTAHIISHLMISYNLNFYQANALYSKKTTIFKLFILEKKLPRNIIIHQIMSYFYKLDPIMLALLYNNLETHQKIKTLDTRYYKNLGLFKNNFQCKSKFIQETGKVIMSHPVDSRPHFLKLRSHTKTVNYHAILPGILPTRTYRECAKL
jgi:hypothetical protein